MDLQLSELIGTQYAFHGLVVGGVLLFALLVYVFGFKSAVEPPFDKLTNPHEDRKANGKKKKPKEKKSQSNGHIATLGETKKEVKPAAKKDVEKSPVKEKSKPEKKTALKENRDAKPITPTDQKKKGKGKENVEVKNKKNKQADEKPKDFDDGEWEQAPSRKDKKKKTTPEETSPSKLDKKKEIKKKKEDIKDAEEIVVPIVEEPVQVVAEEPVVEEIVTSKSEPALLDSDVEQTEPKEQRKKNRKKKAGSTATEVSEPIILEPFKPSTPPPQVKPKKEPVVEPTPVIEVEKIQPSAIESTVVFDELGDTWKEARVPKKGGKKKSRKE